MPRDARMIGKVTRVGDLFDFYGALLTERQRELVELYYCDDWSLAEIADHLGVSRQAVHDNLRRAEEQLEGYERALGLVSAHRARRTAVEQLCEAWEAAKGYVPEETRARVQRWVDTLAEEYR